MDKQLVFPTLRCPCNDLGKGIVLYGEDEDIGLAGQSVKCTTVYRYYIVASLRQCWCQIRRQVSTSN